MEYIFNRETFLLLKELQKLTAKDGKNKRIQHAKYLKARRDFYHNKGINVPSREWGWSRVKQEYVNLDKEAGFIYHNDEIKNVGYVNARYLNVLYGIVKGKPYNKIEQKVEKGNELSPHSMRNVCLDLGVEWDKIRDIIWASQNK